MLLANAVVATHTGRQDLPMIYRVHEAPTPESIRDFAATAHLFGFPLPSAPTNEELQALFQEAKEMPCSPFLATAFIRSMKLANYSTENIGHYGLGLPHYTHFTSPIRRYVDLLVHRALLAGAASPTPTDLQEIASQCSEKERLSAKAESSVTSLKKLRYLAAYKAAGHDIYAAIVIAMKPLGILFELPHLLFEGWLPIAAKHLKIGSEIEVQLQSIDLITREVIWSLYTKKTPSSSLGKTENKRRTKKTHRH
jgi:ribonuclease R